MRLTRSWLLVPIAALLGLLAAAQAQTYPTRPVKIIMPQPPGGIADITLRAVGQELSTVLGQPVIIENRPGAAGNIAGQACAQAQPDGYTLCMLSIGTLSLNPFLYKKVSYDPEKDFAPISMLFFIFEGLMVNPSLGVNSLKELIELSKTKPGTLNYVAQASSITVFMETLKKNTGADLQRIPYAGGNEAALAVISGQAPVGFFGIGNLYPQITEGKVKLLAVDATERTPLLPDAPTLAEAGYTGLTLRPWWGLFGPAGTPQPVVDKVHAEVVRILSNRDFVERTLVKRGLRPAPMPLDDFKRFLMQDREQSRKLISDAGLVPE